MFNLVTPGVHIVAQLLTVLRTAFLVYVRVLLFLQGLFLVFLVWAVFSGGVPITIVLLFSFLGLFPAAFCPLSLRFFEALDADGSWFSLFRERLFGPRGTPVSMRGARGFPTTSPLSQGESGA